MLVQQGSSHLDRPLVSWRWEWWWTPWREMLKTLANTFASWSRVLWEHDQECFLVLELYIGWPFWRPLWQPHSPLEDMKLCWSEHRGCLACLGEMWRTEHWPGFSFISQWYSIVIIAWGQNSGKWTPVDFVLVVPLGLGYDLNTDHYKVGKYLQQAPNLSLFS